MNKNRGWTLIELVVVIVILAILGAIAVITYQDLTWEAKIATTQGIHDSFQSAINMERHRRYLHDEMPIQAVDSAGYAAPPYAPDPGLRFLFTGSGLTGPYQHRNRLIAGATNHTVVNLSGITPDPDPSVHCRGGGGLEQQGQTGAGWVYYVDEGAIYATTPDCDRANPATW